MFNLILGDCLEKLPYMIDGSIKVVVTSPPYNLGNNHHTGNKRHNPYNDDLPESEYQENQIAVMNEIFRILSDDGWLFYNHKNRIKSGRMISPYEWIFKTPFIVKQEIVWNNRSSNMDDCRFFPFTERIYCLAKSEQSTMKNVLKLTDDWHIAPVGTSQEHTRAFPQSIPDRLLASVESGDVLDPYMGKGTVALSCVKFGRNFTGIEINPDYYSLAMREIETAEHQVKLPIQLEQAKLTI